MEVLAFIVLIAVAITVGSILNSPTYEEVKVYARARELDKPKEE